MKRNRRTSIGIEVLHETLQFRTNGIAFGRYLKIWLSSTVDRGAAQIYISTESILLTNIGHYSNMDPAAAYQHTRLLPYTDASIHRQM